MFSAVWALLADLDMASMYTIDPSGVLTFSKYI
jgi:hypothetical protein